MEINRNNYEVIFLDFIEGKLSSADKARLMSFLADNPDLEKELNEFENVTLLPESIHYEQKNSLKKDSETQIEINDNNFDEYCIAKLEGDLNPFEERKFANYLRIHPGKINDYKLYLKTVLEPDKNIKFELKSKLKHRSIGTRRSPLLYLVAAAASLTIILIIYKMSNNEVVIKPSVFAKQENIFKPKNVSNEKIIAASTDLKSISKEIKKDTKGQLAIISEKSKIQSQRPILLEPQKGFALAQISNSRPNLAPIAEKKKIAEVTQIKTPATKEPEYLTVQQYVVKNIKRAINQDSLPLLDKKEISLWALAKSGVSEFNKLVGTKINIDKEIDTTNNRTVYAFNSGLLGFYSSSDNK